MSSIEATLYLLFLALVLPIAFEINVYFSVAVDISHRVCNAHGRRVTICFVGQKVFAAKQTPKCL